MGEGGGEAEHPAYPPTQVAYCTRRRAVLNFAGNFLSKCFYRLKFVYKMAFLTI